MLPNSEHLFQSAARACPIADAELDTTTASLFLQSILGWLERTDRADTIILGCTGFVGVADTVHRRLADSGYPVPVINPLPTAVLLAAMMVNGGLAHSRQGYRKPNLDKAFKGFEIPRS